MARNTDSLKWKKVKAGSLIAVYWNDCKSYFACKVLRRHSEETPKSRFFVEYEDQSKYWHNLATTKFRWVEDVGVFFDEFEGETGQESDGTPPMISENDDDGDHTKLEPNDRSTPATKQPAKKRKKAPEISEDSTKEDDDQETRDNGVQYEDEDSSQQPKKKVKEGKTTKSTKTGKSKSSKSSPKGTKTALSLSIKSTVKNVKLAHENKETTKQDALLSLLMVHRMAGTNTVTYERLVKDLGCHPKTKALTQTWKEIRQQNLVEEDSSKGKQKLFQLTQEGIDNIAPDDYKHELANPPKTTVELHERIKGHAVNNHAVTIFERLLHATKEESSLSRTEMAAACGVTVNTKSYACALKQLRENGYAVFDPKNKHNFVLSEKCFIN